MGMYFKPSVVFTGGTVSGNTYFLGSLSAGTIYSGSSNLYEIFAATGDISYLQDEINQLSGGTSAFTQVSVFNEFTSSTQNQLNTKANLSGATFTGQVNSNLLSATTVSGETYFSGSTPLSTIINNIASQYSGIVGNFLPLSGGTVTGNTNFSGNLSGTTIFSGNTNLYNIFSQNDYYTTGSTFDNITKLATFNRNDGGNYFLNLSALSTADIYVTGFTYDNQNNLSILQNGSYSSLTTNISIMSGLTINGSLSATTYLGLPLDVYVTGGTYSNGTAVFSNNSGGTFSVSGFSVGSSFTGGTVSGETSFTNGLTANTISTTTITGGTIFSGSTSLANIFEYQCVQRTGSTISFDKPATYGFISGASTGNITGDYTNARQGVVQLLIHSGNTTPTIPATWEISSLSDSYTTGVINNIYIEWLESNITKYIIAQ